MLVYCDSVVLIYFFDHTGHFNIRATNRMAAFAAANDRIAISDLVRLEYHIAPLRNNDAVKLGLFDAFCARPDVQFLPIQHRGVRASDRDPSRLQFQAWRLAAFVRCRRWGLRPVLDQRQSTFALY